MKITRRNFMALMAATATVSALTLSGCSSNSTASSSAASSTASSAAASSAAETGTRTVDTDKGPVEIPVNPQVIFSDYYLGEFLAVGVKPVIASPYSLNNPFLADYVDGIEAMNVASAETSLEMIAEAQPDLIVTITEADYEKYSEIAPTVYIQDGQRSDEELFCYIADFNDRVMDSKDEIQSIVGDRTVSIVEVWPQQIYTMGSHFARGGSILYDMWELKAPAKVQEEMVDGDTAYETVSLEALPDYTGDFILYGVLADTDSSFVDESQLWQSLDAVKEGRVLSYEQVAFMHRDPITLNAQLEIFLDFFRGFKEQA